MKDDKTVGLFCVKDRKFYMYDPGPGSAIHAVDRLRNYLIARDLVYINDDNKISAGYKIMTLAQANLENLEVVTVHHNKHIRDQRQKAEDTVTTVWG